jgi:hypothetical protein
VVALANRRGFSHPALLEKEEKGLITLSRRIMVLVAACLLAVVMAGPPALAADGTPGPDGSPGPTGGRTDPNDSVQIQDMFDMQMKMNHLAQVSEMSTPSR